jgi:hypothetical protein
LCKLVEKLHNNKLQQHSTHCTPETSNKDNKQKHAGKAITTEIKRFWEQTDYSLETKGLDNKAVPMSPRTSKGLVLEECHNFPQ